jgi:hypothetical protein
MHVIWHDHVFPDPCSMRRAFLPEAEESFVDRCGRKNFSPIFGACCDEADGRAHEHDIETAQSTPLTCGSHRQPLQGVLEKGVLESWLKRARIGFTDSKLRSDFELRGAMDFQIDLAALRQRGAHCLERQPWRIAIPAEMSEHDALDFSRQ